MKGISGRDKFPETVVPRCRLPGETIPGSLRDRVGYRLKALLTPHSELEAQPVGLADAVSSAFRFYGFSRWRIAKRMRTSAIDHELMWVDLGRLWRSLGLQVHHSSGSPTP